MLVPGDALVAVDARPPRSLDIPATALVVALERGKAGGGSHGSWQPAEVTLLVPGPKLIRRDFTWIGRFMRHADGGSWRPI